MPRRELTIHQFRLYALWAVFGLALLSHFGAATANDEPKAVAFSRAWLWTQAEELAKQPFQAPKEDLPDWISDLDWDGYQSIKFRPEQSLWREQKLPFQARLFHLGLFFKHSVSIYEVVDGLARPIPYSKSLFEYGPWVNVPNKVPPLGFAGFRVHTQENFDLDMFSFLGASYFRAVGSTKQYGLSARGLAINTGFNRPEEFPEFRKFWLERPAPGGDTVTVHALLDSPSVAGAYSFVIKPGEPTVMDVEAHIFPRKPIERLGIAPLTSMFQCGENDRRVCDDFRPEIHDSDGLQVLTGTGEWIWRPIVNSPSVRVNSFLDENPKGFGLLQRDRDFGHFQDDGAYYDKRPSLWVEPIGDWGSGAVQLVEIPAADETFDNIVAFWHPQEPIRPGRNLSFNYRLHWGLSPPVASPSGQVIATRIGAGGIPGAKNRIPSRKFVIDFKGGRLAELGWESGVTPVITASRGTITAPAARPVKELGGWRCNFDLVVDGKEPVDLRAYLSDRTGALTETWLYQYTPN